LSSVSEKIFWRDSVFADRLKTLRLSKAATQEQVSVAVGIGLRRYAAYESGENLPRLETVIALADYFNVSLDYLVGRTDKKEEP
jgi:transcriptional regulator with XRE-family HTH domain